MAANYFAQTSGSGQSGKYTNAPGEGDCTSCHSGSSLQTSGNNWNNMLLDNGFGTTQYIPDSTYSMTLTYKESGKSKFGFAITALDSATGKPIAGAFTITNSSTTQKSTYTVSGSTRTSVYHKTAGTAGNGAISWTFSWKAPSTNVGTIIFYAVVNSTNSNNQSSGDVIYAKEFNFRPSDSLPTASISATPNPVCEGDTLRAAGSGTMNPTAWKWTFANSQNVSPSTSTNQDEKFVFAIGGTYKLYLQTTNNKGKSLLDSAIIAVNPQPNISIAASGNTAFCQGDSVVLTANYPSGATLLWNTGDTTDQITVKQAGDYTCKATNATGCSKTSSKITVSVVSKPNLTLSVSPQSSLCSMDTFNLTVSPSGLSNYYIIINGTSTSNGSTNTYSLPYSGTSNYSISALADSVGCMSDTSNSLSLTYSSKLAAPNVVCDTNTSSSITFKWQGVTNATGYQVSEDSGATWITPSSGNTGLTHTVNGLANNIALKLFVRATDNGPCNIGDEGSVSCSTGSCTPIKYSTNNYKTSICAGDSAVLAISFTNSGNYSISLDGATATSQTGYVFKPTQNTSYTFDLIDSSKLSCPATTFKVDIVILPALSNISIQSNNANNTWCPGEAAKFTSASVSGYTYEFFVNGSSVQKGSQNDYTSTTLQNGDKVKVTATNTGGCQGTSSEITVTIQSSLSNITIQANNANNAWCPGEAAKFTSPAVSGYTYEFFVNGTSVQKGTQNDYTSSTLQNGDKVKVTATNSAGCSGTSSEITVTIQAALSNITLQSNNANNTWCNGESAKFTSPSVSGYNYEFFVNGTSVQNSSQNDYTTASLNTGDKVKVTATNAGGCSGTSSEITATITPGPVAKPFKYVSNAQGVIFNFSDTVAANATYTHTWNFGDSKSGVGTVVNHTYTQNGTYTVWMIIKNGNCVDSISAQIIVSNNGISSAETDGQLSIWPNPFTHELNISWSSDSKPLLMELHDVQGSKILSVSQSTICNISSTTLATESLTNGIYWLKVVMQNGQTVKRIIKL
ncbi:MAG: choice-of-anchor V domain-containing protein [Bacteroidota bacterium]|nr:choice-of-anchor V domain-containing protein [Bacteroidota bacterium]